MRPPTFKSIVLTCGIICVLIMTMQLLWLNRIYNLFTSIPVNDSSVQHEFNLWIVAVALLVVVLVSMAVILFTFYRQRFRQEVQKEFLNNFMHELKTPVSVMGIAGRVLLSPGIEQQQSRLRKYAGIIKDQAEQLENNINRILEVALSERKEIVLAKEDIDVNTMITRAVTSLQPLIDEKSAVIEFTPGPEPLRIHADGMYIMQVVLNLLDNSLKYSASPRIRVEAIRTERSVIISVEDNGIGIEKKHHKDIFRKFFRVPTGNVHNVKGFGIGLNFAKKVIDAHQGRIEVESSPGIGSKFSIHMPLN
jgi:two-component system, OmpR family, phosphate regulon sensor histidine kinase PhoR